MFVSALTALTLASAPAFAEDSEVGVDKKFGLGVAVGSPITFTGKYAFDRKNGVAFHVGTWFGWYYAGKVQFEQRVVEFGDWNFGDLGLYWAAGVVSRFWTGASVTDTLISVGITGGAGVEMRFKKVPVAVFVEADLEVYPVGHTYGWVGFNSFAGGRWYS